MIQFAAAVTTPLLAAIGFLLLRWIRREWADEQVSRRLKILTLHERLRRAHISMSELVEFEGIVLEPKTSSHAVRNCDAERNSPPR